MALATGEGDMFSDRATDIPGLQDVIDVLVAGFDPVRIVLFGSHAVDAAVDPISTDLDEIERRGDMPGDVLRAALRDGVVVYERAA